MQTIPHNEVYNRYAEQYDLLRSRMDYLNNLKTQLLTLADFNNADVVELAAGTGRLTSLYLPMARSVVVFDLSEHMLRFLNNKLMASGYNNWQSGIADNRSIPLPDACADIIVEGWSLGYMVFENRDRWQSVIAATLTEWKRLLRPGGIILIVGTLGTGTHHAMPPNKELADLYRFLQQEQQFAVTPWFKTDYRFSSIEEAEQLARFFWSERLAEYVRKNNLIELPECTAIWYWRKQYIRATKLT